MNAAHCLRWSWVFLTAGTPFAFSQAPEVVLHPNSQIPRSALLTVRPYTRGWVLLENSVDLKAWQPVANLLTTNNTLPFVDWPGSNAVARFYRVRSPGATPADAKALWAERKPSHYQYRFEATTTTNSPVVTWVGTVTISNGVKTVSGVTANGEPSAEFDPADFLLPEDLFDFIAEIEQKGARLAHVIYDQHWWVPTLIALIRSSGSGYTEFKISELMVLNER